MIETIKISKSYGRNSILNEISINIDLNEITGLLRMHDLLEAKII